jgi:hypothetical protein
MATDFSQISPNKFVCNVCTISCNRKTEWVRHLQTKKHISNQNGEIGNILATSVSPFVCECSKSYNDRTGLWRHKKKCCNKLTDDANEKIETNLILQLIKQNHDFKDLIIEQNKTFIEAMKHNNTTNNNTTNNVNSNNKTFNLQVFLNEDCKDAMNITDFVNSINFQLSDLEYMGEVGYVNGISNIIIKNLNALDVTKRPVHCTDPKRETIYIKDGGVWEKDNDNNKLRKMIKSVAFRNSKVTKLFKEKYPDCNQGDSKYSDVYNKIVIEAMGGGSKCNDFDSENKIMKKIAKVMTIDKSTF